MKPCFAITIFLCLILAGEALAQQDEPLFRISLRGWMADIDAETNLIRDIFGGRTDVDGVLGMDRKTRPDFRLRWQTTARNAVEFRLVHLSYDADEIVFRPFIFDRSPAIAFNRLEADVKTTLGRVGWRWAVVAPENGAFRLETMLDLVGGEAKARYTLYQPLLPFLPRDREQVRVRGAIPTVGLAATITPSRWFEIGGEVSGMTAGRYGHTIDWEVVARVRPWQWLGFEGGYRSLYIKGSDGDDEAKFDFRGPFVGTNFHF